MMFYTVDKNLISERSQKCVVFFFKENKYTLTDLISYLQ